FDIAAASHTKVQMDVEESWPWTWITLTAFLLVAPGFIGFRHLPHRPLGLTEKDTVVLADFANSTGDPVFDGTLRQGLTVQLEQSPFLSLVSEPRIQKLLALMGKP